MAFLISSRKLLVIAALLGVSLALDNGMGATPAMGWNTWNHYGCDINEPVIR